MKAQEKSVEGRDSRRARTPAHRGGGNLGMEGGGER